MSKPRFFPALLILTLVMGVVLVIAQQQVAITNLAWAALVYFFLLTLVLYKIAYSALPKDNKTFLTRIYSVIGLRFLFSLFPLLIYLLFANKPELSFAVFYLLLYFFYTAFEIYFLVVNLRPDLKK